MIWDGNTFSQPLSQVLIQNALYNSTNAKQRKMCHAPTVHLETCFFLFFLFFFAGLTQFMLLETMELSQIQTYLIGVLLFINFFFT